MAGKHAKFSPSASSRWIPCPGSLRLSEGIVDETSPYAHEGTVCHDVASKCLKEKTNPADFLGEVIEEVLMTQELIDGIQMYVDEVRGLTKELKAQGGKIEFTVEIAPDCWGTLDAALWNPDLLFVCDLKMGKGVIVQAEENSQLMIYAVGVLKWLHDNAVPKVAGIQPKRIILCIIQPRTVDPIRRWEISRDDLVKWYKEVLLPALEEGNNGDAPCVPGEEQCRWCKASAVCSAQAEYMLRSAEKAFKPYTETETPKMKPSASGQSILSVLEMVTLLPIFKHLRDWMGSIDAYVLAKALDGIHIPGYKLVEGRSNRKWKLSDVEVAKFVQGIGFDPYGPEPLLSPAKMEKLIGKKEAEGLGLPNYIHKPPGAKTLVIESDKRPAVDMDVEKEFADVIPIAEVSTTHVETIRDTDVAKAMDDPIIIPDESTEREPGMSALDTLMAADMEDSEEVFEIEDIEAADTSEIEEMFSTEDKESGKLSESLQELSGDNSKDFETATGGDLMVVASAASSGKAIPPKAPMRLNILNMGKGGVTLSAASASLSCSVNQIKMHLRYLNERDGYGYEIYSDGAFKVFE